MNKNEKISIIMGIYNCAKTLPEAIDSILNQTYANWELIMCDDCSTDDTYKVAKAYADKFPEKIVLIKNDENMRLAYTLNHCLRYATGEYIARMDGDDISIPERFEKELNFLKNHPEYDLVSCAMQRFNDEGLADVVRFVEYPDYYTLRNKVPFCHAALLAKRYVYDKLAGYTVSERTKRGQDYDLWFRFFYEGFKGYNLQEALYFVREDAQAIRRRTFRRRWEGFKTTRYGFRLLGYPKHWIIGGAVTMLVKSITPYRVIEIYREWQKNRAKALDAKD